MFGKWLVVKVMEDILPGSKIPQQELVKVPQNLGVEMWHGGQARGVEADSPQRSVAERGLAADDPAGAERRRAMINCIN